MSRLCNAISMRIVIGLLVAGVALLVAVVTMPPDEGSQEAWESAQLWSTTWNVDKSLVFQAIEKSAAYGFTEERIVFLYAKQIENPLVEHPTTHQVVRRFSLLLTPPSEPPHHKHWLACAERLDRILATSGDTVFDEAELQSAGWLTFGKFVQIMPAWSADCFVFPEHYTTHAVTWDGRSQLSGLCYFHAPVALQHYLVEMHGTKVGMIDMSKMIRQSFTKAALEKHIFDDQGGSSHTMLKHILEPNSIVSSAFSFKEYEDTLKQFGPGLVSGFTVHQDFYDAKNLSYDGKPQGSVIGNHAMVLVGVRKEKNNGKQWFLLQNWWKKMQFCEVSEEYLEACGATVYFVKTPQMKIPEQFPTQIHHFAENENVDKAEKMAEEDPFGPPQ